MQPSTLRSRLRRMDSTYLDFWERLANWRDSLPEGYEREELSDILGALIKRKNFSLADWETLTKVQSKLICAKSDPVAQTVAQVLGPAIRGLRRK